VARDVAVIGVGMSNWGELWGMSLRDIFVDAALKAIEDSGVDSIQALYVGNMSGGLFTGQEHLASLLADYLGVTPIPSARGLAVKMGYMDVALGMHDIVLAGGVEKMTDVGTDQATFALAAAADQDYEVYHGITFPGLYAMIARAHMEKYGTTREQLARVAVKNHEHGSMNPIAQYPHKVTVEQVMNSVMIADPLRILDCSPITDGAAAIILCTLDIARKISNKNIVKIIGIGHATDHISLNNRPDITELPATGKAAQEAYKMANIKPSQLDLIELHDCFTIAEICVLEELGITAKGKGGEAAESGLTKLGGKIPVNLSGGLKAKGHPVGATGVAQVVEIVTQLRGEAGMRQVENAKVGLAQNMGGSAGSTVVHILEVM
jgi:acetyl-CoA C-acetyltransferase